jgi:acid phosphatase type 7
MKSFWQILYNGGADLVINGHAHNYERFAPQDPNGNLDLAKGLREFVVGTGVNRSRPSPLPRPTAKSAIAAPMAY